MSGDPYHGEFGGGGAGGGTGASAGQAGVPRPEVERVRIVAGCMTGTSIDGIDVAVAEIIGSGLAMRVRLLASVSMELDGRHGPLAAELRQIAEQVPLAAGHVADVSRRFALLHADAVRAAAAKAQVRLDLVVPHGQTVFHRPPVSWQMFSPAVLARELGVPVVCDLRAADLAAGGQGAPITPLADWVIFRNVREGAGDGAGEGATAVINLGGFANFTVLPPGGPERICAGDICACNHVLDQLARGRLGAAFDRDGAAAMAGRADAVLAAELEAICGAQARGGRSLGTGDEVQRWIDRALASELSGPDVCATACGAIGAVIGRAVAGAAGGAGSGAGLGAVLLFGGGSRNAAVAGAIGRVVGEGGGRVRAGASTGVGAGEREALAMAVLGALCQDRVAITLPQVTGLPPGVAAPVAGVWTYC